MAQAVRRSSLTAAGSRVRVSVTPYEFRGGRNGVWVGFFGVPPVFPRHKFHSTISPHSFSFISFASMMVRQAWSAGILVFHRFSIKRLHRISSLAPTLYLTRVDIYLFMQALNQYIHIISGAALSVGLGAGNH